MDRRGFFSSTVGGLVAALWSKPARLWTLKSKYFTFLLPGSSPTKIHVTKDATFFVDESVDGLFHFGEEEEQ